MQAWGLAAAPSSTEWQDGGRRAGRQMAQKRRISQQARLEVIVSELTRRIGQPGSGMHHVVRAEDWPVMPVLWHEFELRPFDFFDHNPAMDLPK